MNDERIVITKDTPRPDKVMIWGDSYWPLPKNLEHLMPKTPLQRRLRDLKACSEARIYIWDKTTLQAWRSGLTSSHMIWYAVHWGGLRHDWTDVARYFRGAHMLAPTLHYGDGPGKDGLKLLELVPKPPVRDSLVSYKAGEAFLRSIGL